jgi:AraC family transcriptional regulator
MDPTTGRAEPVVLQPPRFVETQPMRLAGLSGHFTPATMREIPRLWQRFGPMLDRNEVPTQVGRTTYGIGFHCFDGSPTFEYQCAVEVTGWDGLPIELRHLELPAMRWAVFEHRGHVSGLGETIEAIHQRWLPTSGLAADHRPGLPDFLERYGERFDPVSGLGDLEVWYPVRR